MTGSSARRFDLLVFDWDGTLVDSAAHIVTCLQAAFRELGLAEPTEDSSRHVIGLGLLDAMRYLNPGLDPGRYQEVSAAYSRHFLAGHEAIKLFPDVYQGIEALKAQGYLLAVATGKSRRGLDRDLRSTTLDAHFHATRCADEGFPKPNPDMLKFLIRSLGTQAGKTLMIGDTTHDLQMAASAGTPSLAVAYGAHPRRELEACSPLACVDSFAALLLWLKTAV